MFAQAMRMLVADDGPRRCCSSPSRPPPRWSARWPAISRAASWRRSSAGRAATRRSRSTTRSTRPRWPPAGEPPTSAGSTRRWTGARRTGGPASSACSRAAPLAHEAVRCWSRPSGRWRGTSATARPTRRRPRGARPRRGGVHPGPTAPDGRPRRPARAARGGADDPVGCVPCSTSCWATARTPIPGAWPAWCASPGRRRARTRLRDAGRSAGRRPPGGGPAGGGRDRRAVERRGRPARPRAVPRRRRMRLRMPCSRTRSSRAAESSTRSRWPRRSRRGGTRSGSPRSARPGEGFFRACPVPAHLVEHVPLDRPVRRAHPGALGAYCEGLRPILATGASTSCTRRTACRPTRPSRYATRA